MGTQVIRQARGETEQHFDAIVVGAGLAGLYMLYRLRGRGLRVCVLEAADGVGGTWYWNAYPGARCDVESMDYSYSFSPELEQEWEWTEKYASQPEILRYINHVADRFNLRPHIRFKTEVTYAHYLEDENLWELGTASGDRFFARYCIFATGCLSAPLEPPFPGIDRFEGEWYQTQKWPHRQVDFRGKRVGVIGTGSSGIQLIPVIADEVARLYVFQRTPNFSVPRRNRPLTPAEVAERKANYREHRRLQRNSPSGIPLDVNERSALEMTPEERLAEMELRWAYGGAPVFNTSFADVMTNKASNDIVADFVRQKIREKVHDPELAEQLIPYDHPIAAKRLCVDHGYFETFNRDNVNLVNVRKNPIREITPRGVLLKRWDRVRGRHARLRARIRRDLRCPDQGGHSRPRRGIASRGVGSRARVVPRPRSGRVSQSVHRDRSRQSRRARSDDRSDRTARRMDRRVHRLHGAA